LGANIHVEKSLARERKNLSRPSAKQTYHHHGGEKRFKSKLVDSGAVEGGVRLEENFDREPAERFQSAWELLYLLSAELWPPLLGFRRQPIKKAGQA